MKPVFKITNRGGGKALWVNGQNIWEMSDKELTEDVEAAIISAYYLGMEHMRREIAMMPLLGDRFISKFAKEE